MNRFPTSAVLLSRQPLRPCCQTPWIRKSIEAVNWVKQNRLTLLTSTGMQTWEFLMYLARSRQVEQVVLVPAENEEAFKKIQESVQYHFELDPELVSFKAVLPGPVDQGDRGLPYDRDCAAVFQADILLPVSVRPGGHMEELIRRKKRLAQSGEKIENRKAGGFQVNRGFQIDYLKKDRRIAYHINKSQVSSEAANMGERFIIHWTRGCNGPWPDERKGQYYADVENQDAHPRSAFHTLMRILETGKLMASSAHKPKAVPTVSFSGLPPVEAAGLMRWRSRYRQMTFEPYGIGIEKEEAERLGILPVRYYHKGEPVNNEYRWRLQSAGTRTNWKNEMEYRFPGDFYLPDIDCRKMICFCRTKKEACAVEKKFGIKTYAFCK